MKTEQIERLAVAATAEMMGTQMTSQTRNLGERVLQWKQAYWRVLAEFIEQEKAERAREEVNNAVTLNKGGAGE